MLKVPSHLRVLYCQWSYLSHMNWCVCVCVCMCVCVCVCVGVGGCVGVCVWVCGGNWVKTLKIWLHMVDEYYQLHQTVHLLL